MGEGLFGGDVLGVSNPPEAFLYALECSYAAHSFCESAQVTPDSNAVMEACIQRFASLTKQSVSLFMPKNLSSGLRASDAALQSHPAVQAGRVGGKVVGQEFCGPTRPTGVSADQSVGGGRGKLARALRWLGIGGGTAAAGGAAWYFLNRPSGGSGNNSGGGDVVELRPRRQFQSVSTPDVGQKAARVAVGGGILAVLGAVAARLLMLTPQGAAASFMMLPSEHSSEVY